MRGATQLALGRDGVVHISTHAPLAGRDKAHRHGGAAQADFNPRAPCGARLTPTAKVVRVLGFQPTRPLRGATVVWEWEQRTGIFQPTRPLRGATSREGFTCFCQGISTHAPLAGRDRRISRTTPRHSYFNPRAPCGARRNQLRRRAGHGNFNPRAPCGARRLESVFRLSLIIFQPTRPLRGATAGAGCTRPGNRISTHAPLAGRDRSSWWSCVARCYFNPRAPCGARQPRGEGELLHGCISTHAPLAGRDAPLCSGLECLYQFQPTRPLRGATGGSGQHSR